MRGRGLVRYQKTTDSGRSVARLFHRSRALDVASTCGGNLRRQSCRWLRLEAFRVSKLSKRFLRAIGEGLGGFGIGTRFTSSTR